jgi:squalene-hopene/tetraprenyl-beta-curcumene cyclase
LLFSLPEAPMRLALLLFPFLAVPSFAADIPQPAPTKSTEPVAREFSAAKAAEYLDGVGIGWTRERKCITCHTNMPYLTARPLLKGDEWKEVRAFLEKDVESWSSGGKPKGDAYVVATAFALAFNDAQQSGKLHAATKAALDKMWTVQEDNGAWDWLKCDWPPLEHDDYYGAVLAALAVGYAPGDYAKTDKAKVGLEKLKAYLKKTSPPDLHHTAMLLWASTKLDGLMTAVEQKKAIESLTTLQHKDGGWCLPSLGEYKRRDARKTPNDPKAESDGYGTGFVTFVLLQAGVKPTDVAVVNGVKWLKANQRESGRWYTRSLNNDRAHYITNAGTAFCVLALDAAGEKVAK